MQTKHELNRLLSVNLHDRRLLNKPVVDELGQANTISQIVGVQLPSKIVHGSRQTSSLFNRFIDLCLINDFF